MNRTNEIEILLIEGSTDDLDLKLLIDGLEAIKQIRKSAN